MHYRACKVPCAIQMALALSSAEAVSQFDPPFLVCSHIGPCKVSTPSNGRSDYIFRGQWSKCADEERQQCDRLGRVYSRHDRRLGSSTRAPKPTKLSLRESVTRTPHLSIQAGQSLTRHTREPFCSAPLCPGSKSSHTCLTTKCQKTSNNT